MLQSESKDCQSNIDAASLRLKLFKDVNVAADAKAKDSFSKGPPQVVVSAAKLPILYPNKFDLWKMRIKQYFLKTDYYLWEVILNGDSHVPTRIVEGKSASTPIDAEKPLLKDSDGEDVNVHTYRQKIYNWRMSIPWMQIDSWQCKKQTVVATSSIEAEYVAAASGCAQNQVGDLSTHTARFISPALTQKVQVDAAVAAVVEDVAKDVAHMATPSPPPHGISSPPQEPSLPPHQPSWSKGLKNNKVAQQLEIVKLKARVKKLENINMVKSSNLRRLKKDERIELVADQEKDAEVEGRHADKQAELYYMDQDHSSKVLSMQEDDTEAVAASTPITAAKPKILNIAAAPAVSTRRRKGVIIRDPKEELSSDTPAKTPK
nr:hypothetical protein [Tanacetum cinerariifolium]